MLQRLEKIEKRLDGMEQMLKELLRLAQLNSTFHTEEEKDGARKRAKEWQDRMNDPNYWLGWGYESEAGAAKQESKAAVAVEERAPNLSEVWDPEESSWSEISKYFDDDEPVEEKVGIKAKRAPQKRGAVKRKAGKPRGR